MLLVAFPHYVPRHRLFFPSAMYSCVSFRLSFTPPPSQRRFFVRNVVAVLCSVHVISRRDFNCAISRTRKGSTAYFVTRLVDILGSDDVVVVGDDVMRTLDILFYQLTIEEARERLLHGCEIPHNNNNQNFFLNSITNAFQNRFCFCLFQSTQPR